MERIIIYYFSGTGNSYYIAKELQKRIPSASLVPIVGLLRKEIIDCNAEVIGIIFPTHGMTAPIPVQKFLKKLDVKQTQYIFAVSTRCGTKCFAFSKIQKILRRKGKTLDSYFVINMPNNDPKFEVYEVPTQEQIAALELKAQSQLDAMGKVIKNKERSCEKDSQYIYPSGFLLERLVLLGMKYAAHDGATDYFYCDSKCTGCGTCEKVCLSQKIKMVDNKPVWQDEVKCYLCYACLNYCPKQAAQIKTKRYMKSYTYKNGRYPHPYATANDIAEQK